jgi:hypothetical protein
MMRELLAVVDGQASNLFDDWPQASRDCSLSHLGGFLNKTAEQNEPRGSLDQRHRSTSMSLADDRIALPMSELRSRLNGGWALGDADPAGDLPTSITPAPIPFPPFALTAEMTAQRAT